jgi:hypothetical protein
MKNKVVINISSGAFSLSKKAIDYLLDHGYHPNNQHDDVEITRKHTFDAYFLRIERHNPILVECVESLGSEANGICSNLKVEEIDSDRYRISNYYGKEYVETPENINWIKL